jgi:hypothetical protein
MRFRHCKLAPLRKLPLPALHDGGRADNEDGSTGAGVIRGVIVVVSDDSAGCYGLRAVSPTRTMAVNCTLIVVVSVEIVSRNVCCVIRPRFIKIGEGYVKKTAYPGSGISILVRRGPGWTPSSPRRPVFANTAAQNAIAC